MFKISKMGGYITWQQQYYHSVHMFGELYSKTSGKKHDQQKDDDILERNICRIHIDILEGRIDTELDKGYKERYHENEEYRKALIEFNGGKEININHTNYREDVPLNQYFCEGYIGHA